SRRRAHECAPADSATGGHGIPRRPSPRRSISRRDGRRRRSELVAEADAPNVHLEIIETMSGCEIGTRRKKCEIKVPIEAIELIVEKLGADNPVATAPRTARSGLSNAPSITGERIFEPTAGDPAAARTAFSLCEDAPFAARRYTIHKSGTK